MTSGQTHGLNSTHCNQTHKTSKQIKKKQTKNTKLTRTTKTREETILGVKLNLIISLLTQNSSTSSDLAQSPWPLPSYRAPAQTPHYLYSLTSPPPFPTLASCCSLLVSTAYRPLHLNFHICTSPSLTFFRLLSKCYFLEEAFCAHAM